jgi:hypothetical protein
MMEVELIDWLQIITVIAGTFFASWKILRELSSTKTSKLREEYKFAKEFLEYKANKDGKAHPYIWEKGLQALAGTNKIKPEEVEYILSLKNPSQCLKDFVLARRYLEDIETTGDLKLSFKKKYKADASRKWRKLYYVIQYFITALFALSPISIATFLNWEFKDFLLAISITLPIFGFVAYNSLIAHVSITRGEHLVKSQSSHTKRVIV